jgi:hypothetical protein
LFENGAATTRFEEVLFDGPSSATPLSSSTPFSMNMSFDAVAARASGRFDLATNCVAERGLTASVTISRAGGGVVTSGVFPVPGEWALEVPDGCSGGDFTARAELLLNGLPAGPTDTGAFTARQLPLLAGPLTPESIEVVCGVGARATLTLEPLAEACAAGTLSWMQRAGPALTLTPSSGRSVDVQSAVTDLSLVGQVAQLDISVDAGVGSQAVFAREVRFTAPPFVTVEPSLRPLLPTTEEPVDGEIVLTNTQSCAVDALSLSISLKDLAVVPGSLSVDRTAIGGTISRDQVVVAPLTLGPGQRAVVRFRAQPRLVGTPSFTADATVRGLPVTLLRLPTPASGCGCDSGGGGLLCLLLLGQIGRASCRERVS